VTQRTGSQPTASAQIYGVKKSRASPAGIKACGLMLKQVFWLTSSLEMRSTICPGGAPLHNQWKSSGLPWPPPESLPL